MFLPSAAVSAAAMAVTMGIEEEVKEKIRRMAEKTFCGSGDPEASDALNFHEYFLQTYPVGSPERDNLQQFFTQLGERLWRLTGKSNPEHTANVLNWPSREGEIQRLIVTPWQLGLAPEDSIKGPSKIVYILDTVQNFLTRPYSSEKEPLDLLFAFDQKPGETIRPWSLVHSVGTGKSCAARIILECLFRLQLPDAELMAISSNVQALLCIHATYDPAVSEEEQLQRTFRAKAQMAERFRPDPLMMASRWSSVLASKGLVFAAVIDDRINAFNKGQTNAVSISAVERNFIKLYRHQSPEFLKLLDYHWQNFKVAESAVPLKVWSTGDLSPDTKQVRADRSKPIWSQILKWSPEKNYYWLLQCIGVFVKNIKEIQLSGKKVNLKTNVNKLRVNFKDITLHDQACLFTHFLPEWKKHLSVQQLQDVLARFSKGYLNKELEEKVKTQDADIKPMDFRFVAQATGSWSSVLGPATSAKTDEAELASEQAELNVTQAKLANEVALFTEHTRLVRSSLARTHEEKVMANLSYMEALGKATEEFSDQWLPCRAVVPAGVLSYTTEVQVNFAEKQGFPKDKMLNLYVASFDKLGTHWQANAAPTVDMLANAVGSSPKHTAAIVIAPNVGRPGDAYDPENVHVSEQDIEQLLKEDNYNFSVTRGYIGFTEDSIGNRKNQRPGGTVFWFIISKLRSPDGTNKLLSLWRESYLKVRKRTMQECPTLPRKEWVNPCAVMARPLGGDHLSKTARSRQWATGESFWSMVLRSSVEWLGLDRSWSVAVVDLHPYDGTLQKAVANLYNDVSKLPFFMSIAPVWSEVTAARGYAGHGTTAALAQDDDVDNVRIVSFVRRTIRQHVQASFKSGQLTVPGLVIPQAPVLPGSSEKTPQLDESKFTITCPNAAGHLPLRQARGAKQTDASCMFMIIL